MLESITPDFYSFLFTPLAYLTLHTCRQIDFSHWDWKLKIKLVILKHRQLRPEVETPCVPTWGSGFNVMELFLPGDHKLCLPEVVPTSGQMWGSLSLSYALQTAYMMLITNGCCRDFKENAAEVRALLYTTLHTDTEREESHCRSSPRKMKKGTKLKWRVRAKCLHLSYDFPHSQINWEGDMPYTFPGQMSWEM